MPEPRINSPDRWDSLTVEEGTAIWDDGLRLLIELLPYYGLCPNPHPPNCSCHNCIYHPCDAKEGQ